MSLILQSIHRHSEVAPLRAALMDDARLMTYAELNAAIREGANKLEQAGVSSVALLADNGIPWVLADFAARYAQTPCVPLPHFFSSTQMIHAIRDSGVNAILTDRAGEATMLLSRHGIDWQLAGECQGLQLVRLKESPPKELPARTAKITYTSGTTGEPKGVCLSAAHMEAVAVSLLEASAASASDQHLCLTPLSTLLENIGGVDVPLLAGACCCVPSLHSVGLNGASGLDPARMVQRMHYFDANTAILAPQMLQAFISVLEQGMPKPPHLRFIAVGGAPISPSLLDMAARLGIPTYEGYGLSECASVVALNTPTGNRPGTVGRPLPHVSLAFAGDGEILVNGQSFLGYLGHGAVAKPWATGDIGFLDIDGYLHVTGRKKDMFITSLGRNVAPEWVENQLMLHALIAQAAVFGEGRPWNCAVIVPRCETASGILDAAIDQINHMLPDYARIHRWVLADEPFSPGNGQMTSNGRLRRSDILAVYQDRIDQLYQEKIHAVL